VAQKFHLAFLRIEVSRVSCGLSTIAELLVLVVCEHCWGTDWRNA